MPHKTKEEAHYRLPEKCCASCDGSYYSSYGDALCKFLRPGSQIDAGGVCDEWRGNDNTEEMQAP